MASPSNCRILKNSAFLYARMAVVMAVNLYVVRLVLNALGVVDYGIYDVVAGIVVMFTSVTNVLSMSTQRYFSYAIGENKKDSIIQVFSSCIVVFSVFSFLIILLGESVGVWFLNTYLDIPANRLYAANWVYQYSILSFILTIFQTPFSSAIIAYEDMGVYSVISLGDCFMKLLFVSLLTQVYSDKLIYYAFFLMIISLANLFAYSLYVYYKYEDCKFNRKFIGKWRELLVFAGWTMFGSAASISISQVCTILINIFFGPIVNAARAIAFQVSGALNSFTNNFLIAIRPPMIKAYAEARFDYLNTLFMYGSKLIFYGMLILFIPLFLDIKIILDLWLNTTDPQTVLFCRLMLIYTFILVLSNPITIIMHATGYVKQYHTLVEIPTLAIMPITYLLFKLGCEAYTTYLTMIVAIIISHIVRVCCLKKYYSPFSLKKYILSFFIRGAFVLFITLSIFVYLRLYEANTLFSLLSHFVISIALVSLLSYVVGLEKKERAIITNYLVIKFFGMNK